MTQLKFKDEITEPVARFEFRERRTGVVVELTVPFPCKPEDTDVYQALKAFTIEGMLEMGGMVFENCGEFTEQFNSEVDDFDPELN